jgi:hydrogenase maturation factor
MSNEKQEPVETLLSDNLSYELILASNSSCGLDAEGHCVTCSDEALPARVLRVDSEAGLALVTLKDATEEIDITLVDNVAPGDLLLVHGGVAIAQADEASDE